MMPEGFMAAQRAADAARLAAETARLANEEPVPTEEVTSEEELPAGVVAAGLAAEASRLANEEPVPTEEVTSEEELPAEGVATGAAALPAEAIHDEIVPASAHLADNTTMIHDEIVPASPFQRCSRRPRDGVAVQSMRSCDDRWRLFAASQKLQKFRFVPALRASTILEGDWQPGAAHSPYISSVAPTRHLRRKKKQCCV